MRLPKDLPESTRRALVSAYGAYQPGSNARLRRSRAWAGMTRRKPVAPDPTAPWPRGRQWTLLFQYPDGSFVLCPSCGAPMAGRERPRWCSEKCDGFREALLERRQRLLDAAAAAGECASESCHEPLTGHQKRWCSSRCANRQRSVWDYEDAATMSPRARTERRAGSG
jgi:hypothetical protein